MILDKYLTFDNKVIISIISGCIWIYFRNLNSYKLLPRKALLSILLVGIWIYVNYYEPLALPIGLLIMHIYSKINNNPTNL